MAFTLLILLADVTRAYSAPMELREYDVSGFGLNRIEWNARGAIVTWDGDDFALRVGREAFGRNDTESAGRSCRLAGARLIVRATPREHARLRAVLDREQLRALEHLGP